MQIKLEMNKINCQAGQLVITNRLSFDIFLKMQTIESIHSILSMGFRNKLGIMIYPRNSTAQIGWRPVEQRQTTAR